MNFGICCTGAIFRISRVTSAISSISSSVGRTPPRKVPTWAIDNFCIAERTGTDSPGRQCLSTASSMTSMASEYRSAIASRE
ncbi:Uncharacterised protein [Mycobacteroides abscessus subsp. abscessus]|nr:Uncharacterised protein [Mycobacteroides abscessus subsp. abscessus]